MKTTRIYALIVLLLTAVFPSCAIIDFPLFVIDNDYYKTSLQPLYLRYFTNELVGLPRKTKERDLPEELDGEFFFFEYGRLTKVLEEL